MRRNKFNAVKTEVNGIKFDSKAEAKRYFDLTILQRAGEISQLELQPKYDLVVNGFTVCAYVADFKYREADGGLVVEDVKSPITAKNRAYRIKLKLMKAIYGIDIKEVGK